MRQARAAKSQPDAGMPAQVSHPIETEGKIEKGVLCGLRHGALHRRRGSPLPTEAAVTSAVHEHEGVWFQCKDHGSGALAFIGRQLEKQNRSRTGRCRERLKVELLRFLIFQLLADAVGFGTTFKHMLAKVAEASKGRSLHLSG
jgi:hypothetical protein